MADISFHHGVRTSENPDDVISIRTAQSGVVFLAGTAPDADAAVFPLDTPVLIKGASNYSIAKKLGATGTLKRELDAIFDQGARERLGAYVYVCRVAEGLNAAETLSNLVGDGPSLTGVHAAMKCESLYGRKLKPKLFCVPGYTSALATDGVATATVTAPGRDYAVDSPPDVAITGDGTGAEAIALVVDGEVDSIVITKPGYGYTTVAFAIETTPPAVTRTVQAGNTGNGVMTLAGTPYSGSVKAGNYLVTCTAAALNAGTFSVVDPDGVTLDPATVAVAYDGPVKFTIADGAADFIIGDRFIVNVAITNGFGATAEGTVGTVGNPVAHELEGILEKLRAIAFIDGPSTTDAAAVLSRGKYGSERLYICDPRVQVYDTDLDAYVPRSSSGRFAGVQVRVDKEIGFYKSVSNERIFGIDGVERPISYGAQTNYLNENCVGTIVSFGDGFRTWGNRNTANTFLAVRRTKDFINEAIEDAYLAFVDKPMNDANIKFLLESGLSFLRTLEAEAYILKDSSHMWLDPDLNSPTEMRQGRITLSVKFEPPPPMEDIRVIAHPNIQAYTLLLDRIRGAVEQGPLSSPNL